jgi:hypothetical protein
MAKHKPELTQSQRQARTLRRQAINHFHDWLDTTGLDPLTFRLLDLIMRKYMNPIYKNLCWVSQHTLAHDLRVNQGTISRHMEILFAIGALERMRPTGAVAIKDYLERRFGYRFTYLDYDNKHARRMMLFRLNHEWQGFHDLCLSEKNKHIIADLKAKRNRHTFRQASNLVEQAAPPTKIFQSSETAQIVNDAPAHQILLLNEEGRSGEPPGSLADLPTFQGEDHADCKIEGMAASQTPPPGRSGGCAALPAHGSANPLRGTRVGGVVDGSDRPVQSTHIETPAKTREGGLLALPTANPTPADLAARTVPVATGLPSLASLSSNQADDIDELLDRVDLLSAG